MTAVPHRIEEQRLDLAPLLRFAVAARAGPLATFSFRAEVPLFVNQPVQLVDEGDGNVAAFRCDGVAARRATANWKN